MTIDLAALVYQEARLLDAQRWDDWLALFAADAFYWVPLSASATDPTREQSIAYEDHMLLQVRIERLKAGRAPSQHPPIAAQHILQAPLVDLDTLTTHTPFLYVETRNDTQTFFAGTVTHRFVVVDAFARSATILLKRVDLVNAQAVLPPIFLML